MEEIPMGQSVNCEIFKELKIQHEENDRISSLPDHVLVHIISLLPIWSAVGTSLLSKRWKNVWTGINTLDLTNVADRLKSHEDHSSFRNFLDKILFCKDVRCLQQVVFDLSGEIDRMHASVWISLLMNCGIRKLDLSNEVEQPLIKENDKLMLFSPSFFTSHTLVELMLSGNIFVSFPVSLQFPSVKVVSMEQIFLDGTSVRNLLSGCPVLEDLNIVDCEGEGNIDLHSYSLKKLNIGEFGSKDDSVITINAPNLHDLLVDVACSCVIAPNLRHLSMCALCWRGSDFQISYMPSLEDAHFSFDDTEIGLLETLRSVRSVKSLTLIDVWMPEDSVQGLPMFSNLTFLDITMFSWPIILHLLELSPNLEYFVARFVHMYAPEWSCPPRVPDCMLDLVGFKIEGFDGGTFMFKLILYIFLNAKFLEEMIIVVASGYQHLIEPMQKTLEEIAFEVSSYCDIRVQSVTLECSNFSMKEL